MAKITGLEQKTYNNKPSGFKVTFDDGRSGNLNEKESDKGLRVGDEVTVKEIPYTSKQGVASILYGVRLGAGNTPSSQPSSNTPPPRPEIHVGAGKSKQELKVEATIRMAETVIQGFFNDKVESANIAVLTKEYSKMLASEIDEIFATK